MSNNECVLFNKDGKCNCKVKNRIERINLLDEFEKIRKVNNRISILKLFEKGIPQKNYWENFFMSQNDETPH